MDIEIKTLYNLIGKSFTLLDGTIADIYMLFQAFPIPFFLIKRRGCCHLQQIDAINLIDILETSGSTLYDDST